MEAGATVGFFGKLPCRGDFLRRRVPDDFVSTWDDWLQQCLAESREELQEPWLDTYLTGPMWRFVLSEGICGTGAYAGVLMPSVDRVGRCFPLTIVTQWSASACAVEVACSARAWFSAIEELAADALETSDLDAFDARVARAEGLIRPEGMEETAELRDVLARSDFPHGLAQWHVPLASVHSLQRAVNALAARELERTLRPLSLWWSDGTDEVGASWLCARGLPEPQSFAAMLTGQWNRAPWRSVGPGMARTRSASTPSETVVDAAHVMRITAAHEPIVREWGAGPEATHFVMRPEVGLWGVVTACATDAAWALPRVAPDPISPPEPDRDDRTVPRAAANGKSRSFVGETAARPITGGASALLSTGEVAARAVADGTAAQAIADALYGVEDAGSLTVVVERVRGALDAVRDQLARRAKDDSKAPAQHLGTIVFVARGADCALVFAGPAQAVRCRGQQAALVVGVVDDWDDADSPSPPEPAHRAASNGDVGLIDLVMSNLQPSADSRAEIGVRYESLSDGDGWLISGAPLFSGTDLNAVASAIATSGDDVEKALQAVRKACDVTVATGAATRTLPVLMLGAEQD